MRLPLFIALALAVSACQSDGPGNKGTPHDSTSTGDPTVVTGSGSGSGTGTGSGSGTGTGTGTPGWTGTWPVWVEPVFAFQVDDARFNGDPAPANSIPFTVVAADMDLDGDPDVMLQRHHIFRTEVFENTGTTFEQVNPRAQDDSGLYDNPGIPDLFAGLATMDAAIAAQGTDGLYLWHDENRGAMWHLRNVGPPLTVTAVVNRAWTGLYDLDPQYITEVDSYNAILDFPADTEVRLDNSLVATQLIVTITAGGPRTIYTGPLLVPETSGAISVWKNDPHGVAWVDHMGDAQPEIFITRGGLTGALVPPHAPKTDQLFEPSAGPTRWLQVAAPVIPSDYCRGRQVAWVDADRDGVDELYVSCTSTPNKLLDDPGTGEFVDRAPELGLDAVEPEAFAWIDVDNDGLLDLIHNNVATLEVLRATAAGPYELLPGSDFGLESPLTEPVIGIFDPFTLQAFDYDRDGDLDLWASHFGDGDEVAVLRNDGGTFTNATVDVGLDGAVGFSVLIPADADRDGYIDLYATGLTGTTLWRNLGGVSFAVAGTGDAFSDAVAADVDGDRRLDLVGTDPVGGRRVLLDITTGGGTAVSVAVDAPIGSLVRGFYADGSQLLQVWGMHQTSRYSQSSGPLEFGVGPVALTSLSLQLPGAAAQPAVLVPPGTTSMSLP